MEIYNFENVDSNYTENFGKIDISIKDNLLYINNIQRKKEFLNMRISTVDLISILDHIKLKNRYVIHIINIVFDSTPATDTSNKFQYFQYYKTIIIDNCGNIYTGGNILYDTKNIDLYPLKAQTSNKVQVQYPLDQLVYNFPDFMITYIKSINDHFIFKSINYTDHIINMIKNMSLFAYYYYEFKEENIKNMQIIKDKNHQLTTIIDNEITDFKQKHDAHINSMNDILYFLENENVSLLNSLAEFKDTNLKLTETVIELNENINVMNDYKNKNEYLSNIIDELNNKLINTNNELDGYKNNTFIKIGSKLNNFLQYICCIKNHND